jgi:hypothetical protein
MGCKNRPSECSRSHSTLKKEGLHWSIRAQLARRGGHKDYPKLSEQTATERIVSMRAAAEKQAKDNKAFNGRSQRRGCEGA